MWVACRGRVEVDDAPASGGLDRAHHQRGLAGAQKPRKLPAGAVPSGYLVRVRLAGRRGMLRYVRETRWANGRRPRLETGTVRRRQRQLDRPAIFFVGGGRGRRDQVEGGAGPALASRAGRECSLAAVQNGPATSGFLESLGRRERNSCRAGGQERCTTGQNLACSAPACRWGTRRQAARFHPVGVWFFLLGRHFHLLPALPCPNCQEALTTDEERNSRAVRVY